jgi:fascin 1/2
MFTVEMKSVGSLTGMGLRDSTGKYLTAVGMNAVMQARNRTIGKDELFVIEDSQPQVILTAHNNKMASIRQGIDVTANQDGEWSDKETFQLEFDTKRNQWRVRTADNTYWVLADASGIQSLNDSTSATGLFSIEWKPDGSVGIKASNGRYVTARMNGSLYAVSETLDQRETFIMTIINRPLLVLRCEYGFVGLRSAANPRYECNKTAYDVIIVEYSQTAAYLLKGQNGKYWSIDADGNVNADQTAPQPFIFELVGQSKMAIKAPNGCYIRGEQNGIMSAKSTDSRNAAMWEY